MRHNPIHVLVIAITGFHCSIMALHADLKPIQNESDWRDTDGHVFTAQGGSMLKVQDVYYYYGFDGDRFKKYPWTIKCYSSADLSNWRFEGVVLDHTPEGKTPNSHIPNRCDVIYSSALKKYVMISKHMYTYKGVGISTCDTPTGKFVWQGWAEFPDGSVGGGDQSVFVDDDGKGYLVYTPWYWDKEAKKVVNGNTDMTIAELSPDFLHIVRVVALIKNVKLEAPGVFKKDGKYYWLASRVNWWYPTGTVWASADHLEGPWTPFKPLCAPNPNSYMGKQMAYDSYNSQHDFVFPVKGSEGTFYMYCGDRWSQMTQYGAGKNIWLPLEFKNGAPVLDWHQTWWIDAAKGTWSDKEDNKQ